MQLDVQVLTVLEEQTIPEYNYHHNLTSAVSNKLFDTSFSYLIKRTTPMTGPILKQ